MMPCTVPVSVVIPCFRARQTIVRAVESVFRQTVLPCEVILVDDGSGDESEVFLRQLAARYPEGTVKVLALPANVGVAAARNAGWREAIGDYVAFLDADDAWHPQKLEIQYGFMHAHPDVVLSGHCHAFRNPDADMYAGPEISTAPEVEEIRRSQILLKNAFVTPSVMLKRDLSHRFQCGRRYFEDHLLWMEIVLAGHSVAKLNGALAFLFKKPFGESGLSGDMFAMVRGELANYVELYRDRKIHLMEMVLLLGWTLTRFVRRLGLASYWRAQRKLASLA
jgi:glycosyltransferase involved in cell wall biosynthesis